MDKFKLTAAEFAKMLGISTSAVRHQRLNGKLEGQYVKKDSKYFYAPPGKSRPNKVPVTPYLNPKFTVGDHISAYRPKKYKSYYYKKKNRNVPYDQTKYNNAPNGYQLQLTNDLRTKARIDSKLKASDLEYITDDLVREIQIKKAKEKADRVAKLRDAQKRSIEPVQFNRLSAYRNLVAPEPRMTGRWYNHRDQKMEDYDQPKIDWSKKYYG